MTSEALKLRAMELAWEWASGNGSDTISVTGRINRRDDILDLFEKAYRKLVEVTQEEDVPKAEGF